MWYFILGILKTEIPYLYGLTGNTHLFNCKKNLKTNIFEFDIFATTHKRIYLNPPRVILTLGTPATKLAQEAITEIPILFSMVANPEKYGISGKNISGITSNVPIKSQLVKLKTIVSKLKRIGVIYNPRKSGNIIEETKQAASDMGLELVTLKVSSPKKVQSPVRLSMTHQKNS